MTRVNIKRSAIIAIMKGDGVEQLIRERTEAVRDACTDESSWGGYASAVSADDTRVRGRVWSYARQDGTGKTARAQRMIRNLDAE